MRRVRDLGRTDWVIAAMIFAVALAVRVPFRGRLAYWWDCAASAVAVGQYNPAYSQPAAPGYLLHIMLGRVVNEMLGDPLVSLIWVSVVAGAALAAVGYLLGRLMFDRACGLATAAILATSLVCWFQSCLALPHIADALLVSVTVLCVWEATRGDRSWGMVLCLAICLAAVTGLRQQSAPVLLPVWVYAFTRLRPPRWSKFIGGVVLAGVLSLLWLVPLVNSVGGWRAYMELIAAHGRLFDKITPLGGGGLGQLKWNVEFIITSCWVGLLAAAVIGLVQGLRWVLTTNAERRRHWYSTHREQLVVLGLWVLPMVFFWLGLYVLWPGYVLGYLPGLAIVAGLCVSRRAAVASVLLIVALNVALFVWQPPALSGLLQGMPLTARELQEHERRLGNCLEAVRSRFSPRDVVICHANQNFRWGFRHFQYHLPEYENVMLLPDAALPPPLNVRLWSAQNRRTTLVDYFEPHGRSLLLVVPPGNSPEMFSPWFDASRAQPVGDSEGMLYVVGADAMRQGR